MADIDTLKVKAIVDRATLKSDLSFSIADLSDAMMKQASLFAHYGDLASQATRQLDKFKILLENVEARVYRDERDRAANSGSKVTETQLEKMVARDINVRKIKLRVNEAKQVESVAKTAVEAFRHRRDMLIQQGLISREEMKGELTIRKKEDAKESLENLKSTVMNRLKKGGEDENEEN